MRKKGGGYRAFALLEPADGAAGVPRETLLDWEDAPRADAYTLTIATDAGLNDIVLEIAGLVESGFQLDGPVLDPCAGYFWGVTATNDAGSTESSPYPASFATGGVADFTGDGEINTLDFLLFLNLYAEMMDEMPDLHPGCMVAAITYQEQMFDAEVRRMNVDSVLALRKRFADWLAEIVAAHPEAGVVDVNGIADHVTVVVEGRGTLTTEAGVSPLDIAAGDVLLIPHGAGDLRIAGDVTVLRCLPPTPVGRQAAPSDPPPTDRASGSS